MLKLTIGRNIPAAIWVLGLVSLFMDISSEMIHAYLPLFLVTVLGASALTVGVIEGVAEATASITKVFSGTLSDRLGQAPGPGGARLRPRGVHQADLPAGEHDRLGVHGALHRPHRQGHPRRAARRADRRHRAARAARRRVRPPPDRSTPSARSSGRWSRSRSWRSAPDNFRAVFWVAVIPGSSSFALIAFGVREPERPADTRTVRARARPRELARLGARVLVA